jgi:predicted MFS family arabinose efflux permease
MSLSASEVPIQPPSQELPVPVFALFLLSVAAFASSLSLRVTDPLLPRLASDFAISIGEASYVVTVFSVAYGLSQLLFGPLGDRYGKYRVISWACWASCVTAGLCAVAPNFPTLLVARLLGGATAAAVIPLSVAWIGDVVPYATRQPVIARFLIGQICGISSGVLLGGLAADHFDRHMPFIFISVLFLLIALALQSLNRRLPAAARLTTIPAEGPVLRRMALEFKAVLSARWARVVILTVFFEGACLFGAFAFISVHLHTVFGLSLSSAGLIVMLFGLGGLLFAGASHWLVRYLGEAGMAIVGGIAMSGSLLAIAVSPVWWWSIPACSVCGLGFYLLHNTLQTNATQMAPERRGAAVASFASLYYFGQSVGVAVMGFFITSAGTRWPIVAGAIGVLVVSLNFARLRRNRTN